MDIDVSKISNEWETPIELFDLLDKEFHFTLDPCSTEENKKCSNYFTKKEDGLIQSWNQGRVFMNCPYDKTIENWIKKAYEESLMGATIVCLIPNNSDTKWFHEYIRKTKEVRFLLGRVKFTYKNILIKNPPRFSNIIAIFELGRPPTPIYKFWDWKKDYEKIKKEKCINER